MTALRRAVLAVLLLFTTMTLTFSVAAQPNRFEADTRFRRGVQLFKENNYAAALVEFQRAYQIDPKFQVLYNIGETYYQMQDYANALKAFQRYLADGGSKIAPQRRKDVEGEILTLSKRVATLTITTNEPGASITVDDVPVGTTPLPSLMVSAGRRRVTASMVGRIPVTQIVEVAGGDVKPLRLEIAPLNGPPPKPVRPPPPSIVPMVISWSATGALATGAVVTGVLALMASSDLEDELVRFPGNAEALDDAKSSAFGLGLATDILIGTSIAVAAVSVYLTVDFSLESDASAPPPRRVPAIRMTLLPGGAAVAGSF